jgi:putative membrane protein
MINPFKKIIMTLLKKNAFLAAFFTTIIIAITACNSNEKSVDTKEVATEANEIKFDNTHNEKDAEFLVNAAEINLEEIKLGQLAQQKGTVVDVKELGKMIEQHHTKAIDEENTLAKKMLITIPASPTENTLAAYNKVNDKSGIDLDKAYCDMMIKGHKNAIKIFDEAATELSNIDIKKWAAAMLPSLRSHLDIGIECQKKCEAMK